MLRTASKFAAIALVSLTGALPAAAQVDFSRYVAVGDSLTAGFISASLTQSGQSASYPLLIFRQATGSTSGFQQPIVSDPGVPTGALRLNSLVPLVIAPTPGRGTPTNIGLQASYNNLAVPGANVRDLVATVTDGGGLHDLILRGRGTQLQQAVRQSPTFVTIWAGNNDALRAATSGRVIEGVTLTPLASFEADYRTLVNGLRATGARLAIANIPDVATIPYVTTLSRFLVNPATNQPVLVGGQPVPLIGPNGLLRDGDRVLLPASAELAAGKGIPVAAGGTGQPLSDSVVLSIEEVAAIRARVNAFNNVIRTVANEAGAAFVDANGILTQAATRGVPVGGIVYTPAFLTGGIFSYDGVHPTRMGYAILANAFIASINAQFGAEIEPVNLRPFVFGSVQAVTAPALSEYVGAMPIFSEAAKASLYSGLGIKEPLTAAPQQPNKPKGKRPRKPRG